jgi:two-component system response regulator HydG
MASGLILIVDDDAAFAETLRKILATAGYSSVAVDTGAEAKKAIAVDPSAFALAILDVRLQEEDGLSILEELRTEYENIPAIMVTGFGSVQTAVEAMRLGAFDFLEKPFGRERLLGTVERAIERYRLLTENRLLRSQIEAGRDLSIMNTQCPAFLKVLEMARHVAPTDATVLLTGETGTGKERVANYIFDNSLRRNGPFIRLNGAALSEHLLEAQLFGHRKGAFTGATQSRKGLFEEASGGTIFLDEIGEVSPGFQVKLLRVIQEREYIPVGDTRSRKTDVRVIAATNRDLKEAVRLGHFREDLYFRLSVFSLSLPPLRQRMEDLTLLSSAFIERAQKRLGKNVKGLSVEAFELLTSYDWPGNVRELENVIERAVILSTGEWLRPADFHIGTNTKAASDSEILWPEDALPLREVERHYISEMLNRRKWAKSSTARALGISRKTLDRKISEFGLAPKEALG